MAKRAVRAKKRTVKRTAKKQSFFEKFFTFPRLAVFVFVALLIVFVHQVFLPGKDVKGAATTSSKTQYFVTINLFADKKPYDAKWEQDKEDCLLKTFKVTLYDSNNKKIKTYTLTPGIADSCEAHFPTNLKDKTLKFDFSSITKWTPTGYTYSDGKYPNGKTVKPANMTINLKGGHGVPEGFGDVGYLYDSVDFGLKAK